MERHVLTPEQLNATTICWILCEQIDPRWGSLVMSMIDLRWNFLFPESKNGPSEPLKSGLEEIIFPMDWNVSFACDADSLGFCIQLWQGNKSK